MMYPDNWIYHYFEVDAEMIASHKNLRFEVIRYTGEIYMAFAREGLPPGFASTNEFALAVESETNWTTVICRPHEPEKVYYGLYGGESRAEYDITVVLFEDENCNTDGRDGYKVAAAAGDSDGHRRLEGGDQGSWWAGWW